MNPSIATLAYYSGIAGLFFLNRDASVRTSRALWLPVIYLWVLGSRPISYWLGGSSGGVWNAQAQLDGSPLDAAFYGALLIAGLVVLARRGSRVQRLLNSNWPILVYFLVCFISVLWSDFAFVALKRWTKAIDDLVMVCVVLTDRQPLAAMSRLCSRIGFILIPISLLWIKYFPALGRGYDSWTGYQMFRGVSYDKNILGVITFVTLLGTVWRVLRLLRSQEIPRHRGRVLIAQGALLSLGIYLLLLSNSDTSCICFLLGAALMLTTSHRLFRRKPAAVHLLVFLLAMAVTSVLFLGGGAGMAHAVGRNANLTGRTQIWAAVIPLCPNPLIGAGFESFWLNPTVHAKLSEAIPGLPLNEAHDGYIETYLELGWMGVGLIACVLIEGYRRSVGAFRRDPAWGGLLIAYIVPAAVYNVTEAGFRMMHPMWVFLLLAVVASGGVTSGAVCESAKPRRQKAWRIRRKTILKWVPEQEIVASASASSRDTLARSCWAIAERTAGQV
jgi:exopolysaccharide production protein ExoQ